VLLKFRRTAEAEPFARRAIASAGPRERRLRLALADGFLAAGDRARAATMVQDMPGDSSEARQRILSGKSNGEAIDTAAKALSDVLTSFSADIARLQRDNPPVGLAQVAHYADPDNSGATALLALLLDASDRGDEALALLATVRADDPLIGQVRDVQVRILDKAKRYNQAYGIAAAAVREPGAGLNDFSRLGDVLEGMDRHNEAADAYAPSRRPGSRGKPISCGRSCCCRPMPTRKPTDGPRRRPRFSRRWSSNRSSRCFSIFSAMRSWSGVRIWMPPRR
jgi:hypothetical protein